MINFNKYICQNKVKRFNPALGRFDYFPCGRCLCCLHKKAAVQSKKIDTELKKNKYNFLITLTYDSEHIPYVNFKHYFSARDNGYNYDQNTPFDRSNDDLFYFEYSQEWREDPLNKKLSDHPLIITSENILNHSLTDDKCMSKYLYLFGKDKDGNKYSLSETPYLCFDLSKDDNGLTLQEQIDKYNQSIKIPIINYYDIKLFFKKIRRSFHKYAAKQTYCPSDPFKYFALAEYGEKYHRPHYHIVLHSNNEVFAKWFEKLFIPFNDNPKDKRCICKKWEFGNTNIQRIQPQGSVSSYVSSYVSALYNMPLLYTLPHFKPRTRHSSNYGIETSPDDDDFLRHASTLSPEALLNYSFLRNGARTNFTECYHLYNTLCPTYPFEACITPQGYAYIFNIFERHKHRSRNTKRYFIEKELINYLSNDYPALYEQIYNTTNCKEIGEFDYYFKKHIDSIYYRFSSLFNKPLTKKLCIRSDYQLWRKEVRKRVELKRMNEFLRYQEIFGFYPSLYLSNNTSDEYSKIAYSSAKDSFDRQRLRKQHNDINIKF